jgi:hypothetical protein
MKWGKGRPFHVGVKWMNGQRTDRGDEEAGSVGAKMLVVTVPCLEVLPGRRRRALLMVPEAEMRERMGLGVGGLVMGKVVLGGLLAARGWLFGRTVVERGRGVSMTEAFGGGEASTGGIWCVARGCLED